MARLYLKFPTMDDKKDVLDAKEEFVKSGQKMAGVGGLDKLETYEQWLEKIEADKSKETCGEGRVPATMFLSRRIEDDKLIGFIQIRHELNEFLVQHGGHIGDSVRPSEQGKGYGTEQISLALDFCRQLGIEKGLITCNKTNVASAKTIIKNGGMLENEVPHPSEEDVITQRYWIEL